MITVEERILNPLRTLSGSKWNRMSTNICKTLEVVLSLTSVYRERPWTSGETIETGAELPTISSRFQNLRKLPRRLRRINSERRSRRWFSTINKSISCSRTRECLWLFSQSWPRERETWLTRERGNKRGSSWCSRRGIQSTLLRRRRRSSRSECNSRVLQRLILTKTKSWWVSSTDFRKSISLKNSKQNSKKSSRRFLRYLQRENS